MSVKKARVSTSRTTNHPSAKHRTPRFQKMRDAFPHATNAEGENLCRFCGQGVPKGRRFWCSDNCVMVARLRTDWKLIREAVFRRDRYTCRKCGRSRVDRGFAPECHHIIAVAEGGTHELANLVTLCSLCHREETDKLRARLADSASQN
jgi:hypothetical protein